MTHNKRIILFYFAGLILFFVVSLVFGGQITWMLKSTGLWILPAIFTLLGWLIGAGVYQLMGKPGNKRNKIFFIVHLTGLLFFIGLAIVVQYKDNYYKRNYANTDANHDVMKYFVKRDEDYIRTAFNKLESAFENPNDFNLDAFYVRTGDTIINGATVTVYNIYFTYMLGNNKVIKYFSKVAVVNETATLQLYNLDRGTNDEYKSLKAEHDKTARETMQSINESIQEMPESARKAIIDSITKALQK